MSKPKPSTYKTLNWPAYNQGLCDRGSLTMWFDPAMEWYSTAVDQRGRAELFSDEAIQCGLMLKNLFQLPLRQTTGLVGSLLKLLGLNWAVPDYSTLSRRQKHLIRAIEVTSSNIGDAQMLPAMKSYAANKDWGKRFGRRGVHHRRSLVETKMRCFKRLGERLMSRDFERQVTEVHIRAAILNRFTRLGRPTTVAMP